MEDGNGRRGITECYDNEIPQNLLKPVENNVVKSSKCDYSLGRGENGFTRSHLGIDVPTSGVSLYFWPAPRIVNTDSEYIYQLQSVPKPIRYQCSPLLRLIHCAMNQQGFLSCTSNVKNNISASLSESLFYLMVALRQQVRFPVFVWQRKCPMPIVV